MGLFAAIVGVLKIRVIKIDTAWAEKAFCMETSYKGDLKRIAPWSTHECLLLHDAGLPFRLHYTLRLRRYFIPSLSIRALKVFGSKPSNSAAPPGPWIFPFVILRTLLMCKDINSSSFSGT